MSSFKEEFPSLEDINWFEVCCGVNEFGEENNESEYIISKIQEHCLDKQRVSDIIENKKIEYQEEITSKWSSDEERTLHNIKYQVLEELEKELGLD